LRSPHATSAKAITEPRIQDVGFIEMSFSTAEPPGSPLGFEWVYDSGSRPALHAPTAHAKRREGEPR
jgi:hypothetical protein